jgi:hypothetical protein
MSETAVNHENLGQSSFMSAEAIRAYLQPEVKSGGEVTDEDRGRVLNLIQAHKDIRRQNNAATFAVREEEEVRFARQLRTEGPKAATIILEQLNSFAIDVSKAMAYLPLCAGKENIADILDYLVRNPHQSENMQMTMQRLADVDNLPQLEKLFVAGDDHLGRTDAILCTAYTAIERASDTDRKLWRDFITDLEKSTDPEGLKRYEDYQLEQFRRQSAPDLVDTRYAERFFSYDSEPDLDCPPETAQNEFAIDRLETIRNLFTVAEVVIPEDKNRPSARVYERLVYREPDIPSPYVATVGMEVEIELQSLIQAMDADRPTDAAARADLAYAKLALLRLAKAAGMNSPKESSPEVIWEFASQPAGYYETLAREVQLLMAMDIVSPNYSEHPLHITIGGVTSEGPKGEEAFVLSRSLEATGWCCSGDRLLDPINKKTRSEYGNISSWTIKGQGGIKERDPKQVAGGGKAIELRTPSLQSLGGLERTLRSSYALGAALKAYQTESELDATQQELANVWSDFSKTIKDIFSDVGLGSPNEVWQAEEAETGWGSTKALLDPRFKKLAQLLDESKAQPKGPAGRIQAEIQTAVIEARGKVMTILKRAS